MSTSIIRQNQSFAKIQPLLNKHLTFCLRHLHCCILYNSVLCVLYLAISSSWLSSARRLLLLVLILQDIMLPGSFDNETSTLINLFMFYEIWINTCPASHREVYRYSVCSSVVMITKSRTSHFECVCCGRRGRCTPFEFCSRCLPDWQTSSSSSSSAEDHRSHRPVFYSLVFSRQ